MQTALACFQIVCRINQIDVDIHSAAREHGLDVGELSSEQLLRIAKVQGFTAKRKALTWDKLAAKYPLPAIFMLKDGSYGVLLKFDQTADNALVYLPTANGAKEVSREEWQQIATGDYIILKHKFVTAQMKFGFEWFYTEILKYKQVILEVMTGSFVVQLFGLITPLFTQVILDKVIVHRTLTTLEVLAVAYLFVAVFEYLLNAARNYIFIHTANKIDAKLGAKLFRHLFALPFAYFESRKVGNIVSRVRELDNIREFITNKSISVIVDLFFSTVFVVMMFLYSVQLTLIVLTCVGAVAIIYLTVTPVLRKRLQEKFLMASESNSYLVESITGVQTVKSLAIEGSMQKKWEDTLARYLQSSFKLSTLSTLAQATSNLCQRLMTIAILYFGVCLVLDNKMTIGQLIAFQMFAGQFTNPILRLVNLWNDFQQTLLAVDRIGDILNHPVELQTGKAITLSSLQGAIRFDSVTFQYALGAPTVLKEFSLDIPAGKSVGIIGQSGSGKSTIAKLAQRLYLPVEGAIYIDGIDVRHMNPLWLRNNIGVVLQENYLFSGTIRENICMPKPDASIELIIQVAQLAGAHEFIAQLPQGYDTMVGERGSTLSGGQRQRIAIARALICNPKILIFDEATSALDYESERIIQDNLRKIKAGRTMIIIAHRLSAVADCDFIVAMNKGKIVEMGTHSQLLSQPGYYQNLHNQQLSYRNAQPSTTR